MEADEWAKHPANPYNNSPSKKWKNVALATFTSWLTVFIAPMLVPANDQVMAHYGETNRSLVLLATAAFVFAQGVGPFVIGPVSELYGRRVAYIVGLISWMVWTLACVFAPSLATLTLFRFLSGVSSSIGPALGASTVADHFASVNRGRPLGIYNVGPVLGPVLGPLVGAFLALTFNFRWIFYTSLALLALNLLLIVTLLDESYAPVLQLRLKREQIMLRPVGPERERDLQEISPSAKQVLWRTISRPPRMMRNPFLILFSLIYAWVFSLIYLLVVAIPLLFHDPPSASIFSYRWSAAVFGLAYLPLGSGNLIATAITTLFGDRIYRNLQRKHGGEARAEYRLYLTQWGAILLPVGFMVFGWSAQARTSPVGPMVGEVVLGLGLQLSYSALQTFIVDASQPFSAAAVAATNVLRNTVGAILLVVGPDLFEKLSWGNGSTLIACLSLPLLPAGVLMLRVGPQLRQRFPIKP